MKTIQFGLIFAIIVSVATADLVIVSRAEWQAKPPTSTTPMSNPVPFVVIHHSYEPAACTTEDACIKAMQSMQDYHQNTNGWADIGYHFAVGGDGRAYTGRGWSLVGAHAPGYNAKSIGICVIGDWSTELPPPKQLETIKQLIEYGVSNGYISGSYDLLGHRQVRETECPGDRLYSEIISWDHYQPNPSEKFRLLKNGTLLLIEQNGVKVNVVVDKH